SSRRRHTRSTRDWSSDVCSSDLAILADYRNQRERLWERFNGGREGTLSYYRTLASVLGEASGGLLAEELDRIVSELERLAGPPRSEERRVGKECRGRGGREHEER